MALFDKHDRDQGPAEGHDPERDSEADRHSAPEPRPDPGRAGGGDGEPAAGAGPGPEVERDAPDEPTDLPAHSWWAVLRRTGGEFMDDELPDRAAALTYYGVLSLFPALLVLVSVLGVLGKKATGSVLDNLATLAPGAVRDLLSDAVRQLEDSGGTSGVVAITGLLLAVWSASGYVAAFIRASNAVYDLPEGRPVWKLTPLRIGLTLALMVLLAASALIVVFTGPLAERAGDAIGVGDEAVTAWSIAKWPVLLVLVVLMIALLFWRAPNVHGPGFRWLSPGSVLAVLLWLLASGGFALYVAGFASYNKTYGALAGVVIFLVWLWLSNLAILLGLELDAELARQRAISGGMPPDEEPYVEPRDTRKWPRRRTARPGPAS
ncbi:YihY/virulence factor BrkB family protein [Streptomyces sp. A1499]|uniref:YihY/virulence factor BrkB family protein n=1 Tax=Streptomyces sp. A1499 TaxID=2563104 RepID=UPI00109E4063|nr:YihY/virulence factor BrkB family protein [Streptomyces sp. A1499]THC54176.1 YihY family inner membrane protein [Streptomyces sp. A1499]